jgi:pimeloyl-ACP methyl ester carboxylesterase
VLILHSEESPYIRWDDIHHFRRINDRAKLVVIPGTSHQFLEEGAWDMVLDLTRDWFSYEQVLVTDWI